MNQKKKGQKSADDYRRDIHTLKQKIKEEEHNLEEVKQKYEDLEVLTDKSYTFSMKVKILEYTLNDIRAKLTKFTEEDEYQYYCLNYAVLAFSKCCKIVGINPEMVFRGVDIQGKNEVNSFQFAKFMKDVLRLDDEFINPILKVLSNQQTALISKERFHHFLASFLLQVEQNGEEIASLDDSILRVTQLLASQKVDLSKLWSDKQINIAVTISSLLKSIKSADVLDCVACYCKCDPLKKGMINKDSLIDLLDYARNDVANISRPKLKLKR